MKDSNKLLHIILGVSRALIAVAGIIVCLLLVTRWTDAMALDAKMSGAQNFLATNPSIAGPLDVAMWICIGGLIVCAAAAIIFGIIAVVTNPKRNLRAVIGIVLLVVVGIIGYSIASGNVSESWNSDVVHNLGMTVGEEHQTSKLSGAGLKTFFILLGLTVASVFYLEISKVFK